MTVNGPPRSEPVRREGTGAGLYLATRAMHAEERLLGVDVALFWGVPEKQRKIRKKKSLGAPFADGAS